MMTTPVSAVGLFALCSIQPARRTNDSQAAPASCPPSSPVSKVSLTTAPAGRAAAVWIVGIVGRPARRPNLADDLKAFWDA